MAKPPSPWKIITEQHPDCVVAHLSGTLDRHGARRFVSESSRLLHQSARLVIDLKELTHMDTAGGAALCQIVDAARKANVVLQIVNAPPAAVHVLSQIPVTTDLPEKKPEGMVARMGGWGERTGSAARDLLLFLSETFIGMFRGLFSRAGRRKGSVLSEILNLGCDAVPVVGVIALLLGLILAFQSAYQLQTIGASIYVANLVSVSTLRELGPLMTAVVVSGRSGSAIAAEIGAMKVGEELAALEVMGIEPVRFLVVPRMLAVTITQPLLTAIASLVTIGGGFVIAIYYLDLGFDAYLNQTLKALRISDLLNGLGKSLAFGWAIVLIGSFTGLRIKPSSEAVGRAATTAVVACIFAIIIIDGIITTVSTLMN